MSESDVRTLINGIEDDVLRDMLGFCLDSKISYYELKIYASNNNMHTWINALDRKLTSHHVRTILNMMDDRRTLNDKEERILAQRAQKAEQKYRKRLDRKGAKKMQRKEKIGIGIIVGALIVIACLGGYIYKMSQDNDTKQVDVNQSAYVKPETPVDRSQNVTLPGWGSFTIEANTRKISSGFEFHNPDSNYWYEDTVSMDGNELETLIVDSGNKVEINHYLSLAGIDSKVSKITSYDKSVFSIEKNEDGEYTLEGVGGFTKDKNIKVKTEDGKTQTLTVSCKDDCYYMTFGLYLADGDTLLYQSDLVAHGNYITSMEMTQALKKGTYDAYVVIQPYKSDKKTETNSGVVNLTLNVQ